MISGGCICPIGAKEGGSKTALYATRKIPPIAAIKTAPENKKRQIKTLDKTALPCYTI
jgi:hypothetical protein